MKKSILKNKTIVLTAAELDARNPICLSEKASQYMDEAHKSLMRKGIKFVPTPRRPIDLKSYLEDMDHFKESVRWAYFFPKKNNFEAIINTFESKPWHQRTQNKAPHGSSAVETFLESCLSDIMDESLR